MCYQVILSTTSKEDLSSYNGDLIRFSIELPEIPETSLLKYLHKWYLGSQSECSCTFRHTRADSLGFGEPEDWYPESTEAVEATLKVVEIFRELVSQGNQLDCVDVWEHEDMYPAKAGDMEVDLSKIKNSEFRFFENYYFNFTNTN